MSTRTSCKRCGDYVRPDYVCCPSCGLGGPVDELRAEVARLKADRQKAEKAIAFALAQMRHAYEHIVNGTMLEPKAFADGLLGSAIRRLERVSSGEVK